MRRYLNFTALVLLFAFAGWWFRAHPPAASEASPGGGATASGARAR